MDSRSFVLTGICSASGSMPMLSRICAAAMPVPDPDSRPRNGDCRRISRTGVFFSRMRRYRPEAGVTSISLSRTSGRQMMRLSWHSLPVNPRSATPSSTISSTWLLSLCRMQKRVSGTRACHRAIRPGSRQAEGNVEVPICRGVCSLGCRLCMAVSRRRRIRSAYGRNCFPSSVSETLLVVRRSRVVPSSFSSCRTCSLTVGCDRYSRRAASEKLCVCATVRNASSSRKFMRHPFSSASRAAPCSLIFRIISGTPADSASFPLTEEKITSSVCTLPRHLACR